MAKFSRPTLWLNLVRLEGAARARASWLLSTRVNGVSNSLVTHTTSTFVASLVNRVTSNSSVTIVQHLIHLNSHCASDVHECASSARAVSKETNTAVDFVSVLLIPPLSFSFIIIIDRAPPPRQLLPPQRGPRHVPLCP
eukprot:SAG31_NODE_888_length_11219_cov_5.584712_6_plen_139_part_00